MTIHGAEEGDKYDNHNKKSVADSQKNVAETSVHVLTARGERQRFWAERGTDGRSKTIIRFVQNELKAGRKVSWKAGY